MNVLMLVLSILVSMLPVEPLIVQSPVECYAGYRDNALLFEACGDSSSQFWLTPSQSAAVARGGVVTHNHPESGDGCWVLSPADVYFAEQLQLLEIRAVSIRHGVFRVSSLRRAGAVFAYIPDSVINAQAKLELQRGGDGCDYLSRTWADLAPRYGLVYTVYTAGMYKIS